MNLAQINHWATEHNLVMQQLWQAKFTKPEMKTLLLATGDAELWHFMRGNPPIHWIGLEILRSELRAMSSE